MKSLLKGLLPVLGFALMCALGLSAQNGADTFKGKCAACHGGDGKGDTGMGKAMKLRDLGSADVQAQSDADLNNIVTNGKGKMPKYDGKLSKEQIEDLVKYMRTLKH